MPVGTESLKRTAKSVAAPKKQATAKTKTAKAAETQEVNADEVKYEVKAAAKSESKTKASKASGTEKTTKSVKMVEPKNDSAYTSGIKCELPVHLL